MSHRFTPAGWLAAVALSVAFIGAAATPAQAEMKLGFVDVQRALREVDDGQQAMDKLQKEFNKKQAELDRRKTELESLKEELEKQADMMSADARATKEKKFQEAFIEWQRMGMELQQDLDRSQQKETGSILRRMEEILAQIGKEQGFSMILVKEMILYAPGHYDLTNELIRKYNDRYASKKGKKKKGKKKKGKK